MNFTLVNRNPEAWISQASRRVGDGTIHCQFRVILVGPFWAANIQVRPIGSLVALNLTSGSHENRQQAIERCEEELAKWASEGVEALKQEIATQNQLAQEMLDEIDFPEVE